MTLLDKVRNRTARVRQHRWRMRPHQSRGRYIVIGGCPGSGTTLFRRMLDRHPSICAGPETQIFLPARFQLEPLAERSGIPESELAEMFRSSGSQAQLVDRFAARYLARCGKPRWAEKTPLNVRHFAWVVERFPEARLIHLIRDGRDVVCSLAQHPDWRWVDGGWVKELRPRPPERYAQDWVTYTGQGMRFRGHPRYHEVRYEDLVANPEATLRDLCTFLDEPFDEGLLEPEHVPEHAAPDSPDRGPVFDSSVGRWRRDLPAEKLDAVLRIAGQRLTELGYLDG